LGQQIVLLDASQSFSREQSSSSEATELKGRISEIKIQVSVKKISKQT
jgi:hypothetical protein